jgi:hypothetical protein
MCKLCPVASAEAAWEAIPAVRPEDSCVKTRLRGHRTQEGQPGGRGWCLREMKVPICVDLRPCKTLLAALMTWDSVLRPNKNLQEFLSMESSLRTFAP